MQKYVNSWEVEFMKDKTSVLTSGVVKKISEFYDCDEEIMIEILMNHLMNQKDS